MLPIFNGKISSGFLKKAAIIPANKNKSIEVVMDKKSFVLNKNQNLERASVFLFFPILSARYLVIVLPSPKSDKTKILKIIVNARE